MIVIIDTFYTGSHKFWADQLKSRLQDECVLITLPGGSWKWRMESGGIELAERFRALNLKPDLIIATSMVNLPQFYAFAGLDQETTPSILYFHENQLAYPVSVHDTDRKENRDSHYGFIQIQSAIFATVNIFNSKFNQSSFSELGMQLLQKLPKNSMKEIFRRKLEESQIIYPGIERRKNTQNKESTVPVLLWNHRWEHDKNPELFIEGLKQLQKKGIDFKLIVLGKGTETPKVKDLFEQNFKDELLHVGFTESTADYFDLLSAATHLPITSKHDFFGLSVAEAMHFGATPILPNHQAYPEHVEDSSFFYEYPNGFFDKLNSALNQHNNLPVKATFFWDKIVLEWERLIAQLIKN